MDATEAKRRMLEILSDDKAVFVFSTVDAQGRPHARFMGSLTVEGDRTLYMCTYSEAGKVAQLHTDPNCQILIATDEYEEIVTLDGKAVIEKSPDRKRAFWGAHPGCKTYFTGPEAPEFTLIRMTAERGEYVRADERFEPVQVTF